MFFREGKERIASIEEQFPTLIRNLTTLPACYELTYFAKQQLEEDIMDTGEKLAQLISGLADISLLPDLSTYGVAGQVEEYRDRWGKYRP